jgi:hypothetical protein
MDEEQLKSAVKSESNPIVYYEKEREFFSADELQLITELKKQSAGLTEKSQSLKNICPISLTSKINGRNGMGTESYRNGKAHIQEKESTSAYWIQDLKRLILIFRLKK